MNLSAFGARSPSDPSPPTTTTAAAALTAAIVTLAILITARLLCRRTGRQIALLDGHSSDDLRTEANLLRAAAAHKDAVQRSERPVRLVHSRREHREHQQPPDRRTG